MAVKEHQNLFVISLVFEFVAHFIIDVGSTTESGSFKSVTFVTSMYQNRYMSFAADSLSV